MDLDRLADEALLGSPYRIENGVHPYDQQRAIALHFLHLDFGS